MSLRQQQAQLTQKLVLDATYRLLIEEGYTRTTIAAVAQAAGVAVPTVYKSFGTKAELMKRLYDRVLAGDDEARPMSERPQGAAILSESEPRMVVMAYAELIADTAVRTGPLLSILLSARSADPQLEDFVATIERERLTANQFFATHLEALGGLAVPTEAARDVLWLFTAPDVHYRLVQQRGWTPRQFADWLGPTLSAQLLAPS